MRQQAILLGGEYDRRLIEVEPLDVGGLLVYSSVVKIGDSYYARHDEKNDFVNPNKERIFVYRAAKIIPKAPDGDPIFVLRYFGDFADKADIACKFEVELPDDIEILFAVYGSYSYDGYAYVVFKQDNVLYSVYGSHCSCYGLEGQWAPDTTTLAEMRTLLQNQDYRLSGYEEEFSAFLEDLERAGY
jgi:hypothetical protein